MIEGDEQPTNRTIVIPFYYTIPSALCLVVAIVVVIVVVWVVVVADVVGVGVGAAVVVSVVVVFVVWIAVARINSRMHKQIIKPSENIILLISADRGLTLK